MVNKNKWYLYPIGRHKKKMYVGLRSVTEDLSKFVKEKK